MKVAITAMMPQEMVNRIHEIVADPEEVADFVDDIGDGETIIAEVSESEIAEYKNVYEKFMEWQERLANWGSTK